nr:PRD domain-containing protein [Caproicibacter fermentans]
MLVGFSVVKVLNNNSVLVQDVKGAQMVLMSKGIGFGKKAGDALEEGGEEQKVFYIFDSRRNMSKLSQFSWEQSRVEQVTREIVDIAERRLNIENGNLYGALLDHITFAIECLQMDLPIDNPFTSEISILYREEYDVAQIAAGIIRERLQVEIGEAETGFIALHLYSARSNKHIAAAMKNTRVYSEILTLISNCMHRELDSSSQEVKSFLLSLNGLIRNASQGKEPSMQLKIHVKSELKPCWNTALRVARLVEKDLGVSLGEDSVSFLAVDIHRMVQW